MADGLAGLLEGARRLGHAVLPSVIDAPRLVQGYEEGPTEEQEAMAQEAAVQAARQKKASKIPTPKVNAPPADVMPQSNAHNFTMAEQNAYRADYKKNPSAYVYGYRYYGGTDPATIKRGNIETMPIYFPVEYLAPYLDVYKLAKGKFGLPDVTPEQFTAMALAEGTPDLGHDGKYDYTKKHLQEIYKEVKKLAPGITDDQASFIAKLREKYDLAKKYNVPIDKAWNGFGISKAGKSGDQYADELEKVRRYAVPHKKNAPLRNFIKDRISLMDLLDGLKTDETAMAAKGGSIGKRLPGGSKMI